MRCAFYQCDLVCGRKGLPNRSYFWQICLEACKNTGQPTMQRNPFLGTKNQKGQKLSGDVKTPYYKADKPT